jgi:hypothetical protein
MAESLHFLLRSFIIFILFISRYLSSVLNFCPIQWSDLEMEKHLDHVFMTHDKYCGIYAYVELDTAKITNISAYLLAGFVWHVEWILSTPGIFAGYVLLTGECIQNKLRGCPHATHTYCYCPVVSCAACGWVCLQERGLAPFMYRYSGYSLAHAHCFTLKSIAPCFWLSNE